MPRRIDPKCLACAQLEANIAISLHGPSGDNCWDSKRCPRRRSHYRHRRENNAKRRAEYLAENGGLEAGPEVVSIGIDLKPVAISTSTGLSVRMRLSMRSPCPSGKVTNGLEIEPIHCSGLRNRQIQKYLDKVMEELKKRYGIQKFESQIRMEPVECPLSPCPLKADLVEQL